MLEPSMFNPLEGDSFVEILTSDLFVILPIALGVMATLWGVRLAIQYFKGIAEGEKQESWFREDMSYEEWLANTHDDYMKAGKEDEFFEKYGED